MNKTCSCGSELLYEYALEPISSNKHQQWAYRHCVMCDMRWKEHIAECVFSMEQLKLFERLMTEKADVLDKEIDILLDQKDIVLSILWKITDSIEELQKAVRI